jgi:hypothetical protein
MVAVCAAPPGTRVTIVGAIARVKSAAPDEAPVEPDVEELLVELPPPPQPATDKSKETAQRDAIENRMFQLPYVSVTGIVLIKTISENWGCLSVQFAGVASAVGLMQPLLDLQRRRVYA